MSFPKVVIIGVFLWNRSIKFEKTLINCQIDLYSYLYLYLFIQISLLIDFHHVNCFVGRKCARCAKSCRSSMHGASSADLYNYPQLAVGRPCLIDFPLLPRESRQLGRWSNGPQQLQYHKSFCLNFNKNNLTCHCYKFHLCHFQTTVHSDFFIKAC